MMRSIILSLRPLSLGRRSLSTAQAVPITVARGDGIGPEIMDATLDILNAAGANLEPHFIEVGEKVYRQGHSSGIVSESWDTL